MHHHSGQANDEFLKRLDACQRSIEKTIEVLARVQRFMGSEMDKRTAMLTDEVVKLRERVQDLEARTR